jgi:rSAM/selenodomain-associated transferase 2
MRRHGFVSAATDRTLRIAAVVPALNEEAEIAGCVAALRGEVAEVIVVDGGSRDGTVAAAAAAGARVTVAPGSSRAVAMNTGAALATADIVFFVHADCRPAAGFAAEIAAAVACGAGAGCFQLRFDSDHWLLRISGWCTRADLGLIRFGDQTLFVRRSLLRAIGGFDERLVVMEDHDIVCRLRRRTRFVILAGPVTASARRYRRLGAYRTQLVSYPVVVALYHLRVPQPRLLQVYRRLLGEAQP